MAKILAIGGDAVVVYFDEVPAYRNIFVYDDSGSGTPDWMGNDSGNDAYSGRVYGLFMAPDKTLYSAGAYSNYLIRSKWDDEGAAAWNDVGTTYGLSGRSVCADADGSSYVAVQLSEDVSKFDADGDYVWDDESLSTAYGVAISESGRIYAVGLPITTGSNVFCYDSDGTVLWDYRVADGTRMNAVAVVDDTTIYVVGLRYDSKTVWKLIRDDGEDTVSVAWSADLGGTTACCAVTPSGGVAVGGVVTSSVSIRQFDADGATEWSADHGAQVNGIAVDLDGNVYITGLRTGSKTTRKYSAAGSLLYSFDFGDDTFALAFWQTPRINTDAPGLPIEFALGLPTSGPSITPPALALRIGLAVPAVTPTPLPPDPALAEATRVQIYRLYLATEDLVELPMAEFSCRRRLGASTWLSVVVPITSESLRTLCVGHIDGDLVIYAGYVDGDGEHLGEFLRAVLTDVDSREGAGSGSLVLTGRVQNPSYSPANRTLLGIESKGMDGGLHTARCAVDPLLKPNDTVDDGDDTWLVGSVDYRISPSASTMMVREDG